MLLNLNFSAFELFYMNSKTQTGVVMQNSSETRRKINDFYAQTGKYHPDAYEFITSCVIEQVNSLEKARHLSAVELLDGLKNQLYRNFGFLAANVLEAWDINTASDIGEIVFDLIDLNILSAADDDKRSDFDIALALTDPVHIRKTTPQMEIPQID